MQYFTVVKTSITSLHRLVPASHPCVNHDQYHIHASAIGSATSAHYLSEPSTISHLDNRLRLVPGALAHLQLVARLVEHGRLVVNVGDADVDVMCGLEFTVRGGNGDGVLGADRQGYTGVM